MKITCLEIEEFNSSITLKGCFRGLSFRVKCLRYSTPISGSFSEKCPKERRIFLYRLQPQILRLGNYRVFYLRLNSSGYWNSFYLGYDWKYKPITRKQRKQYKTFVRHLCKYLDKIEIEKERD